MSTSGSAGGAGGSGSSGTAAYRRDLVAALLDVRRCAAGSAEALLQHVPDTGDLATGRIVDDFVEQASDALRALAESVGESLDALEPSDALESSDALDPAAATRSPGSRDAARRRPGGGR